jgi:DNA-binding transcriptional ArsR family regulator
MPKKNQPPRSADPGVATVAALIGEPARAAMLCALLGDDERSAGELALAAGLAANAASAHLWKLVDGGLLTARSSGRQRLFRLAGANVARAVEALLAIAPPAKIVALTQSRSAGDLRVARSCYDHLAGRLGVAVTEALVARGMIAPVAGRQYRLTTAGEAFFASLDVDVAAARATRRHFASQCLDWSERRPHLAGALGSALRSAFLRRGWVSRIPSGRTLRITSSGLAWLQSALSIEPLTH